MLPAMVAQTCRQVMLQRYCLYAGKELLAARAVPCPDPGQHKVKSTHCSLTPAHPRDRPCICLVRISKLCAALGVRTIWAAPARASGTEMQQVPHVKNHEYLRHITMLC